MSNRKTLQRRDKTAPLRFILAVLACTFFVFPVLWMILTGFKTGNQAFSNSASLFFTPTLENYREVFFGSGFRSALVTSLKAVSLAVILTILLASGIAYPMARFPSKKMQAKTANMKRSGAVLSRRLRTFLLIISHYFLVQ